MSRRPPPHGHRWDDRYQLRPNDYDASYPPNSGEPGGQYPTPDNMTDANQWAGLGPAVGDEMPSRRQLNHPWGKVAKLTTDQPNAIPSLTFIQTDTFDRPIIMAVQARFSLDGVLYTPGIPVAWSGNPVQVDVVKSFDIKTGAARERFFLNPGDVLPFCNIICRALTMSVTISADGTPRQLFVQLVAAPAETIDCTDLVGPAAANPLTFARTNTTRFPADSTPTFTRAGDPARKYAVVVNQSNADLFVHLGVGINTTLGSEFATIVLPGGVNAGYEVLNYTGDIYMKFTSDDASGYLLISEGFNP